MNIQAFIFFGIILSFSMGSMISAIIVNGIKNKISKWLIGIILSLVIGFGLVGCVTGEEAMESKMWNNGKCNECNTKFELFEIEYIKNSGDLYYYKCENNHIIKVHSIQN